MFVKTNVRDNLAVIIMSDNVNWVQSNRGTEICSVRLRPDKAGAILVQTYCITHEICFAYCFAEHVLGPDARC